VAWADDRDLAGGRLHLAAAGAPARPDPAPRLRVGPPLERVVRGHAPLRLPVRCSAACDLRAQTALADATLSLPRGHRGIVRIALTGVHAGRRSVHLLIAYGAPGSAHPALRRLTVRVRRVSGARSRA
jgi:hypothetical protein